MWKSKSELGFVNKRVVEVKDEEVMCLAKHAFVRSNDANTKVSRLSLNLYKRLKQRKVSGKHDRIYLADDC